MAKPGSKSKKHGGHAPAPAGEAVWRGSLRTPTKGKDATKMAVAVATRPKSSRTRTQVKPYQAGSGGTTLRSQGSQENGSAEPNSPAKQNNPGDERPSEQNKRRKLTSATPGGTGETPQQTMQAPLESSSQNDRIVPEQRLGTGGGGAALGADLPSSDSSDSAAGSDASESEPDLNDHMESVAGESVENGRATDPDPEPEVDVDRAVYLQERLVRDLDVDPTVAKCFRHLNMSVFIELSEAKLKRMSKEVCKGLEGSIKMLLRAHRKLKLQAGPVDVNGGDGSEAPATKGKYKTVARNLRQWVRPWPIG